MVESSAGAIERGLTLTRLMEVWMPFTRKMAAKVPGRLWLTPAGGGRALLAAGVPGVGMGWLHGTGDAGADA